MTTVNNSMDGSATQEPAPVPNPSEGKKNKAALIIAAIIAVVLVVSVTVGVVVWRRGESAKLEAAKEACSNALASVTKAKSVYEQAVKNASEAKAVTAEQVADAKVVTALSKELNATAPKTLSCTASDADGLNATADKLNTQAKWYTTHEANVKTASENVSKSRDEKTLNDARKALSDKEGTARKLLKDSEGKTPDDVARAQLTQAINAAVEAGKGTDTRKMSEAGSELDKAMKSVNDAVSAKQQADAAKATAAAAAKKAQSSYSGYSGSRYSSNRNYGNNGYKYSYTPKKQSSNNGGSSSDGDMPHSYVGPHGKDDGSHTGPACKEGQSCGIG